MAIGLKSSGPFSFAIDGTGNHTYDFNFNAALLEAQFGSGSNALTAHAGGGQGAATVLPSAYNRVNVVATAGDSVLLPVTTGGARGPVVVRNAQAVNSLNVFPQTGDAINEGAANAAFAVPASKTATFYCTAAGQWIAVLSA